MSAKVHENKLKIKFIIYKYKLYTNSFTLTTNKLLIWYAPHAGIIAIACQLVGHRQIHNYIYIAHTLGEMLMIACMQ